MLRISDPEIRYSLKIPNTDLWKSGNITTGRGLIESVTRRISELEDDAKSRDRLAETKRRQILELTGVKDRAFTYADELIRQRHRLADIKTELANLSNAPAADSGGNVDDANVLPEEENADTPSPVTTRSATA